MHAEGRITVHIAADGMTAAVDVVAGRAVDSETVAATLRSAGLVHGVDLSACEWLVAALADEQLELRNVQVAAGRPVFAGSDGYFAPTFAAGIQPGHVDDGGKMDFRERELLKPVQPGDVLGTLNPARPARAGMKVDGTELPVRQRKEASLVFEGGVTLAADGQVSATRAGVLVYIPGKSIAVVQQHSHRGDVDLRSGHLEMEGSLSVSGDVQRLFRVRATGDVSIGGIVDGGSVYAGGSIRVKGAVRGGEQGELEAQGEVSARSAEFARIVSHGLLTLQSAVHCSLRAEAIEIAALRGGDARAERWITTEELGAPQGLETKARVAAPLERSSATVREALANAKEQRLSQSRPGRDNLRPGSKVGRLSTSGQRASLERTVTLREYQEELLKTAHILVRGSVHPGVTIHVGTAQLIVSDAMEQVRFSFDHETRLVRFERFVP